MLEHAMAGREPLLAVGSARLSRVLPKRRGQRAPPAAHALQAPPWGRRHTRRATPLRPGVPTRQRTWARAYLQGRRISRRCREHAPRRLRFIQPSGPKRRQGAPDDQPNLLTAGPQASVQRSQ